LTLLEAMARMEGFFLPGSRPNRNNNPLDLEYGEFAKAHGASGTDGRFAIFPDVSTGYAAGKALLCGPDYDNLSVAGAIYKFAPPVENNTQAYLNDVCEWAACKPTDMLAEVLG
jgi:hypothetical protein